MEDKRIIKDQFGVVLNPGDTICFTLGVRKDQKPIVKATIKEFKFAKTQGCDGKWRDLIVIDEYADHYVIDLAKRENKLIKEVSPNRVVKCY